MYLRAKMKISPPELDCIKFDGEVDIDILSTFCGHNWGRHDIHNMDWPHGSSEAKVVVWNSILHQWLYLQDGYWLIRGLHGELWPVDETTFEEYFKIVE